MPTQALTSEFIRLLPVHTPPSGAVSFFDTDIKGFMLELRASGGATFYFRYRDAQTSWRLCRIGRVGGVSVADARLKAHLWSRLVKEGGDPKRESPMLLSASPTFADFVAQRYLPYAKSRKRSWATDISLLRNHLLPAFGELRMARIRRADVEAFQEDKRARGYAAGTCNRMVVLMKFIFNCAIRWELLPAGRNPCTSVQAFEDHGARERYLSAQEVQRLFCELDRNPNTQVGQVIKLLLYTGARKREVLDARWEEVDLDRKLLMVPAARSKSRRAHHIPLSDAALQLLRSLPRRDGVPWVFFNPKTNKPPVSIFYAWDGIRQRVGMNDLRLHDLRHSYASFLVNAGRSLYEVQKLLGHHDPKVTMRYAHLSPQSMLEAANLVGRVLAAQAVVAA